MRKTGLSTLAVVAMLAAGTTIAHAHVGAGEAGGFVHGFWHPIGGFDHVLAMVMVGLLAARLGGRALWLVPATFVAVMALGGALGFAGVAVPFVELGIGLSIVVLGGAVAAGVRIVPAAATALVGFFAIFHGHAHGAEMPETVAGIAYGAGFMIATALLHAGGIALGLAAGSRVGPRGEALVRVAGALTAVAGIGIVGGIV